MLIFKLMFKYLGKLLRVFFKFGGILPVGMFIVSDFIINLFRANITYAFFQLSKTLFSAELVINEMVHLAIIDSPSYNIISLFRIMISLYILYNLIKFIGKILIKFTGSQAEAMAYIFGIFIVGIIEVSAVAVIDRQLGFLPIKDGVIFLIMNIKPVLINAFSNGVGVVAPNINNSMINSTVNVTKELF